MLTIYQAASALRNQGIHIRGHQLIRDLAEQRWIRQTEYGYEVTHPAEMRQIMETHTGHHRRRMPDGSVIHHPHTSVRVTDYGLDWIADLLRNTRPDVCDEHPFKRVG